MVKPLHSPLECLETSSEDEHGPLTIVHLKTVVLPAVTPVTVDVRKLGLVIEPGPLIFVQVPAPIVGLFPAKVKVLVAHND